MKQKLMSLGDSVLLCLQYHKNAIHTELIVGFVQKLIQLIMCVSLTVHCFPVRLAVSVLQLCLQLNILLVFLVEFILKG